jgi:hypothetical protein
VPVVDGTNQGWKGITGKGGIHRFEEKLLPRLTLGVRLLDIYNAKLQENGIPFQVSFIESRPSLSSF